MCPRAVESAESTSTIVMCSKRDFPLVTLWQPASPPANERLGQIHTPTLIMVGANENPATVRRADQLTDSIEGARKVVVKDSGHMVNMDAPAEFNRIVLAFLGSIDAGSKSAHSVS